jgi:hypothetical protein
MAQWRRVGARAAVSSPRSSRRLVPPLAAIGVWEQVPELRAMLYLKVAWPPSSWRLIPHVERFELDGRTVWRIHLLFALVFTWVGPPASCPTCLRSRALPVWETPGCPNPVHPGGVWPL